MKRVGRRAGFVLVALQLTLVSIRSASASCPAFGQPGYPPNIILFVADDLGWSDLPFFNPPVEWGTGAPQNTYRNRIWRPALNRDAARMCAGANGLASSCPAVGGAAGAIRAIDQPSSPAPYVVPGTDCDKIVPPKSLKASCDAKVDALRGFGGLRKLADTGMFDRFYASSAVCSPSRASIMTGRHVPDHKVFAVGSALAGHEVTIAEYLKQGCQTGKQCWGWDEKPKQCTDYGVGASAQSCYATGLIGKWHLGYSRGKGRTPWMQGFDEFIGFKGGSHSYFSDADLACSPALTHHCSSGGAVCDPAAPPGGCGKCEPDGLYVGPDPQHGACAASGDLCCSKEKDSKYDIAGRQEDSRAACNSDSGLASEPEAKRCVATGGLGSCPVTIPATKCDVGQLCAVDADCPATPAGQNCLGPVCVGGSREGNACTSDASCECGPGEANCKNGSCSKGCTFDVRVFRDLTLDYIRRHNPPPPAPRKPFLLVVSFHAIHAFWAAPERTKLHYSTVDSSTLKKVEPDRPASAVAFWAIMEEMDAAVGRILDELATQGIDDETLVLFTSDQGRPNGHYGTPRFRGNKRDVREGGIRVGLLARACDGAPANLDGHIASQTDLFATIAEAAGLGLPASNTLSTCENSGANCATQACAGGTEPCLHHPMRTKSFYGLLNAGSQAQTTDFAFAKYSTQNTVVSRPGYYKDETAGGTYVPGGACGFSAALLNRPHDKVRAGSCTACCLVGEANCSAPTDCSGEVCRTLSKVCITQDTVTPTTPWGVCDANGAACIRDSDCPCPGGSGSCDESEKLCLFDHAQLGEPCEQSSCGSGKQCLQVATACGECMPASWKLRRDVTTKRYLWDVATNPEEEEEHLNCLDLGIPALSAIETDLENKFEGQNFNPDP